MHKHLELTPTAGLTERDWQELRKGFSSEGMIGGSDAGALLGLDGKYRSPITLYYDALGINVREVKMNEVMMHGKLLEDYIATCWEHWGGSSESMVDNLQSGTKVRGCRNYKYIAVNPDYPSLFANIDKLITKHPSFNRTRGVLEIKTIRREVSDQYSIGVPPKYIAQCQQYMLVYGFPYAELAYLKDGREVGVLTFEADKEMQQSILEAADAHRERVMMARAAIESFHERNPGAEFSDAYKIAMEYEPGADGLEATESFFSDRHQSLEARMEIVGPSSMLKAAQEYKLADEMMKEWETKKMQRRTTIQQFMQKQAANSMKFEDGGYVNWRKIFKVNV